MQDDFEGVGIGGDDDKFSDASVKGFGGLVGTFFDLLERGALGDQIDDFRAELFGGEGLGAFRDFLL